MGKTLYPLPDITPMDLMWIAGLLEGEGCFHGSYARNRTTVISLRMTDRDVVEKFAKLVGRPTARVNPQNGVTKKYMWACSVTGSASRTLMQMLLPHMGERRHKKIAEVLHYFDTRTRKPHTYIREDGAYSHARLRAEEVREIRRLYATGRASQELLGNMFQCSQKHIWSVVNRYSWAHLDAIA